MISLLLLMFLIALKCIRCAFSFQYDDSSWPVLVLGALMFIPGAYHVRIAYYAYKKYPGYTFDDIPDFD